MPGANRSTSVRNPITPISKDWPGERAGDGDAMAMAAWFIGLPEKGLASRPGAMDGTPEVAGWRGWETAGRGSDYLPWNTSDDSRTAGSVPWLIQ